MLLLLILSNPSGFDESKVDELALLREKQMLEDIKDAIEKKRDLEVKDMEGATAVSFLDMKCLDSCLPVRQ